MSMTIRGSLSRADLEAFLTAQTVPIRLACETPAGHRWIVPLWYRYRDNTLECATAADAAIISYLEHEPAVGFDISTNEPPYAGVRGRGTTTVSKDSDKQLLRTLLERYLGGTESSLAAQLLDEEREEVRIAIEPAVVYGWDYAERMADAS